MTPKDLAMRLQGPAVPLRWLLALLTSVVLMLAGSWGRDVDMRLDAQEIRATTQRELIAADRDLITELRAQRVEDSQRLKRIEDKLDDLTRGRR